MPESSKTGAPNAADSASRPMPKVTLTNRALMMYRRILDGIVTALVLVMIVALLGALTGLILDLSSAVGAFKSAVSDHKLAHGAVYAADRELVIDVLSVFVLIELFRTFTEYLEHHRVRLRVLAEVGIAFILREVFIGLYDHGIDWPQTLALAGMLAVLAATRIAAVRYLD
jgi:uncharacterized membrane protein (DUF373 family)